MIKTRIQDVDDSIAEMLGGFAKTYLFSSFRIGVQHCCAVRESWENADPASVLAHAAQR